METLKIIATNLKMLRELNNYTQEHVAEVLNISQNTYSLIEKGETKLTVDRLGKLAELYHVEITDLLRVSDQLTIHRIINNNGESSHSEENTYTGQLAETERIFYQTTIDKLEKQITHLHSLIEGLTIKQSA